MNKLITELRAVVPKRTQTFGMLLQVTRLQASKLRERTDTVEIPAINLIWLRDQQAIPVNRVASYRLDNESGLTTDAVNGTLEMYVNANEPQVRQRFTLLHEFYHALSFFDADVIYSRLGSGNAKRQKQQIEQLANEFAGNVLMPTMLVKRAWFASQDIDRLARLFCVSPEAMTTRLERLGLIAPKQPESRIFFRRTGIPSELAHLMPQPDIDWCALARAAA